MQPLLLKAAIKVVITIGLLIWLATLAFKSTSMQIIADVSFSIVIVACIIHFLAYLLLLVRWRNILAIYHELSYKFLANSFFIGLFSNNFLPSSIGGDVVRASYLYKQGLTLSNLLTCSVLDRFIGIIVTLLLCIIYLSWFSVGKSANDLFINDFLLLGSMLLILPAVGYVILKLTFTRVEWIKKFPLIYNTLKKLKQLSRVAKEQPQRLLVAAALSLASTACVVFCYYVITLAIGITISLEALFIVVPASFFVASLPVSIGGLGVREGAIIFLLSKFGVPVEQGVALTAVYLFVLMLVTAPGGLFILKKIPP